MRIDRFVSNINKPDFNNLEEVKNYIESLTDLKMMEHPHLPGVLTFSKDINSTGVKSIQYHREKNYYTLNGEPGFLVLGAEENQEYEGPDIEIAVRTYNKIKNDVSRW